jgi:hypothetical protein
MPSPRPLLLLASILLLAGGPAMGAPAAAPPGAQASEARLAASLSPQARAWLKREAARLRAADTVSEAVVTRSVRTAGSGVGLAPMSVEDAVVYMFMIIAHDAQDDLHQLLGEIDQARLKRKAAGEATGKKGAASGAVRSPTRPALLPSKPRPAIPRSAALDAFLASQRVSTESSADLGPEQVAQLQLALDQMSHAEATVAAIMRRRAGPKTDALQNVR